MSPRWGMGCGELERDHSLRAWTGHPAVAVLQLTLSSFLTVETQSL